MKNWLKGGLIGVALILVYSIYFWASYDSPIGSGTSDFLVSMPNDILMYHAISARDGFQLRGPPDVTDILIMTVFSMCMYFIPGAIIGLVLGFIINKFRNQTTEEGFSWLLLSALLICYVWGLVSPQSAIFGFVGFVIGSLFVYYKYKN